MNTRLPSWLPTQGTPHAVETVVARVRQAIRQGDGTIYLTGDGALSVAGAVAARTPGPVRCVRLAGAETPQDAQLLLGWALDLPRPGAAGAAAAALSTLSAPMILVDARGTPKDLFEVLRKQVAPAALEARWMVIIESSLAPTNSIGAMLPESAPRAPIPSELPLPAHALGWLLAGIPGAAEAAFSCRVPGLTRQAIWPDAARALRESSDHSAAEVANALGPELHRHLQLALGGPAPEGTTPADFFALRWIGRHTTRAAQAAMATAAAARLALAWGMAREAAQLVEEAWPRIPVVEGSCRALLRWVQAQIAHDSGDLQTARRHFEEATAALRQERNLALLATMTRSWAEGLIARGELTVAAMHLRNARVLYRQLGDQDGVAATLRGAGDVAIASCETLSAGALLEQAEAGSTTPIEQVNLLISLATMAITGGNHPEASALLDRAAQGAAGVPQLQASVLRRRADMALRNGNHDQALRDTLQARDLYARVGEVAAVARCSRLLGDIHGASGALEAAARYYEQAIHAQIQSGDRQGLCRSLTHAAALEEVSGDPVLARELSRMAARMPAA
jgi:tetratricopeptide (TPR) repeat protein